MDNSKDNVEDLKKKMVKEKRYESIDGLRAYSALGIVLMHVLSNGEYEFDGFVFDSLIPSFTNLVFLFMVISGFSMCCGYYNKVLQNKISIVDFYSKRYKKILPYFTLLCILDFIISPSKKALYEIFANITLCFGLLPNYDITVIGVGWFLGLVFVFYLIFPFYCYLLSSKKRAWFSFVIAFVFNYLCIIRFNAGRTNIIYCGVYFILGGLVYLYREDLERFVNKFRVVVWIAILISILAYYSLSTSTLVMVFLFGCMLVYTINTINVKVSLLNNIIVKKISNISMEIYLSHMVVYRVLEKLRLLDLFESDLISYIFGAIITFLGTIIFSIITSYIIKFLFMVCKKMGLSNV